MLNSCNSQFYSSVKPGRSFFETRDFAREVRFSLNRVGCFLWFLFLLQLLTQLVSIIREFLVCYQFSLLILLDPYNCDQWDTCETCINHNPCGWCELNVRYTDGTIGPQCAGKPRDPNNPPPGYKPCMLLLCLFYLGEFLSCYYSFQVEDVCSLFILFSCLLGTCPGPGFQNLYCPSFKCNNVTNICESQRIKGNLLL